MAYSLGIDLGTTFSAAATIDDDDQVPTMVGLGNRALQIPSVIYVREDGSLVVGDQAEHLAMSDPTRVAREFKRRVGDPVAMMVAGQSYPPTFFMAELLRWILDQTVERRGEPPIHVTLTHPASWGDFKVQVLREAARDAGLPNVYTCSEPVAAAMNYAVKNRVGVGDRICVYDLGGGTFDVCLLAKTPHGFEIIGSPDGDAEVGGINFDKAIIQKVMVDNAELFSEAGPDDPGIFRFHRDCVEAKEALSVDVDSVIPLTLNGSTTRVRLTRTEFEGVIDDDLNRTIEKTRRELAGAGLNASALRSFVLVGGSSRIPLVTEKLTTNFRCAVARNTHPKHEVALGAALFGRLQAVGAEAPPHDGEPLGARVRSLRGARRWLLTSAAVAVTATVAAGGVIVAGQVSGGTAEAHNVNPVVVTSASSAADSSAGDAATSTVTQSTREPFAPSSSAGPSASLPGTATSLAASSGTGDAPTTSPLPQPVTVPATFDDFTVEWFRTLCTGGAQMRQHDLRAKQSFPNLTAAQTAFVDSFVQRANIAASTATQLEYLGFRPVAQGRMDIRGTIDAFRQLADALTLAAGALKSLSPQTSSDLINVAAQLTEQIDAKHYEADVGGLTKAEVMYVQALPGCSPA